MGLCAKLWLRTHTGGRYAAVTAAGGLLLALIVGGCGSAGDVPAGPPGTEVPSTSLTRETVGAPTVVTSPSAGTDPVSVVTPGEEECEVEWGTPPPEVMNVFEAWAASAGAPIFAPSELPVGIVLVASTPATVAPSSDAGGDVDEAMDTSALAGFGREAGGLRAVLRVGDMWLQIFEDVRGDLGDHPSRDVIAAGGLDAREMKVLGGAMVQWRSDGHAYAVYGKGLSERDVERVAAGMRRVPLKK